MFKETALQRREEVNVIQERYSMCQEIMLDLLLGARTMSQGHGQELAFIWRTAQGNKQSNAY